MPSISTAWRNLAQPAGLIAAGLIGAAWVVVLALVGLAPMGLAPVGPALADSSPKPVAYLCDGEPLEALLVKGGMDDPTIPDPSTAPVPVGGFVVLQWRGLSLQLPRTNNAGPASFTDGKWWWSLEDPAHPRFRLRRGLGDVQDFRCGRSAGPSTGPVDPR
jgi:hypothetical protein